MLRPIQALKSASVNVAAAIATIVTPSISQSSTITRTVTDIGLTDALSEARSAANDGCDVSCEKVRVLSSEDHGLRFPSSMILTMRDKSCCARP
jgi:hypothetical protein